MHLTLKAAAAGKSGDTRAKLLLERFRETNLQSAWVLIDLNNDVIWLWLKSHFWASSVTSWFDPSQKVCWFRKAIFTSLSIKCFSRQVPCERVSNKERSCVWVRLELPRLTRKMLVTLWAKRFSVSKEKSLRDKFRDCRVFFDKILLSSPLVSWLFQM